MGDAVDVHMSEEMLFPPRLLRMEVIRLRELIKSLQWTVDMTQKMSVDGRGLDELFYWSANMALATSGYHENTPELHAVYLRIHMAAAKSKGVRPWKTVEDQERKTARRQRRFPEKP